MLKNDEYYMKSALRSAKTAAKHGEVPIGCVIVRGGEIIARGYNTRESKSNALHHAEITAIDRACRKTGAWRLQDCTLYVTLEPCPMCAGAIVNARIKRVVYGCKDSKAGAYGSVFDLREYPLNHKYAVEGGVLEKECAGVLSGFFKELRKKQKESAET